MNVVVIGAGLAGLVSALRLRRAGAEVTLVTKGIGGLQLSQGTIDVLGYAPERVERPYEAIPGYAEANPAHPYATLGADAVRAGVDYLRELVPDLLEGDGATNYQLPTAVGAVRPTAVPQPSMVAGHCTDGAQVVIVGPRELKDFYPGLIADNLSRGELPGGGAVRARAASFSLPARAGEVDSTGVNYARALDSAAYRASFAAAIAPLVRGSETVGLPAVLGLDDPDAWRDVAERIGRPVFEIPLPPPGVPGMRLNQRLTRLAKDARVRYILGSAVTGLTTAGGRVTGLTYAVAGGERTVAADAVVLAAGGFESGALELDSYGTVRETALGLPVVGAEGDDLLHGDFWGREQPLFKAGLAVDRDMRVLNGADVRFPNLYAAGGILAGAIRWHDKSGEGVALGSAVRAADAILEEQR